MNPLVSPDFARSGTALSVNVNKVALLRNTRQLGIPSVVKAATLCLEAGADGITVHPRPDGRHIRAHDVRDIAALLKAWPLAEYNIEGNPFHNLMDFVREVRPRQATFVPDSAGQFTSDHGWDLAADGDRLRPLIAECQALGVRVSLFMDPQPEAMALARAVEEEARRGEAEGVDDIRLPGPESPCEPPLHDRVSAPPQRRPEVPHRPAEPPVRMERPPP